MDKFEKQIQEMLRTSGASLVRRKRHQVWRLPNGRRFVHSSSGSDHLGVRNAAADLRRLLTQRLAPHGEANDPSSVGTEPAHRGKFHAPNRPQRADGIVVFPTSSAEPKRAVRPRTDPVAFSCLDDLLDAVDGVEAFWKLDSYGRIRVLQKLAQPFAEVKILHTLFFSATAEEIEFANAHPDDPRTEEWIVAGFSHFADRNFFFPALWVNDPERGVVMVESSAMGLLAGWDQNVVTDPKDSHFYQMLSYPIWDLEQPPPDDDLRVERYIQYFFVDFRAALDQGPRFKPSAAWTDPKVTRPVIRELINGLNLAKVDKTAR
jgi:hypothetical protein